MTLDGKIARNQKHFPDWTGSDDKRLFVQVTRKAGAVIMGSKTFDTIGEPLPERKNIVLTRDKTRKSGHDNLIFTQSSPVSILRDLEKEGFTEVVLAGGSIINSMFARADLINEIIITIAPRVFGTGISLFKDEMDMQLDLLEMKKMNSNHVLLRYSVAG